MAMPGGQRSRRDFTDLRILDVVPLEEPGFGFHELRGGHVINPGRAKIVLADDRLRVKVAIEAAVRGGEVVADSIAVTPFDDVRAQGVTTTQLRGVLVDSYLSYLLTRPDVFTVGRGDLTRGAGLEAGPVPNPKAATAQGKRDHDRRLAEVVTAYVQALDDPAQRHRAAAATVNATHLSRSYVMRLLKDARDDPRYAHLFPRSDK